MLRKLFSSKKPKEEEPQKEPPVATVYELLRGTSKELEQIGIAYAVASILPKSQQDVIALRTASLRLHKLSRQFSMSADLLAANRIDEEGE